MIINIWLFVLPSGCNIRMKSHCSDSSDNNTAMSSRDNNSMILKYIKFFIFHRRILSSEGFICSLSWVLAAPASAVGLLRFALPAWNPIFLSLHWLLYLFIEMVTNDGIAYCLLSVSSVSSLVCQGSCKTNI